MKSIFVSSTFSDMQAERDLVQERIAPRLRKEAKLYGDSIDMIDLRWGVNTTELDSEEGIQKVASTCIHEVERSQPYMLIFLGERYGTTVKVKTLKNAIGLGEEAFTIDEEDDISLTAMEIEYGAFFSKQSKIEKCIFCLRKEIVESEVSEECQKRYQEDNADRRKKIKLLKDKIRNIKGCKIIEYSGKWHEQQNMLSELRTLDGELLEERIVEEFKEIFMDDWLSYAAMSWQEREWQAALTVCERHLRAFRGREELVRNYLNQICSGGGTYILKGVSGCGKTSLFCKLMSETQELYPNTPVFCFFSGNSQNSDSVRFLLQQMVYYLEQQLGIEEHYGDKVEEAEKTVNDLEEAVKNFDKTENFDEVSDERLEEINKTKQELQKLRIKFTSLTRFRGWMNEFERLAEMLDKDMFFFIDAIDVLEMDEHVSELKFILQHEKLHYIITCNKNFKLIPGELEIKELEIPLLAVEDVRKVIYGIFGSHSKDAYEQVIGEIEKKQVAAQNPLYLSLLMQRLNMMNSENLSNRSESEIIEESCTIIREMSDEMPVAVNAIIDEAIARINPNTTTLRDIVNLISITRDGISEKDLYSILEMHGKEYSQLDAARLIDNLDSFFIRHYDGRLDYTSDMLRECIREQINDENYYLQMLLALVKEMDEEESLRYREGLYLARKMKDVELAITMFAAISQKGSFARYLAFKQAVIQEGLADNGEFYSMVVDKVWDYEEATIRKGAKHFFNYYWKKYCGDIAESNTLYVKIAEQILSIKKKRSEERINNMEDTKEEEPEDILELEIQLFVQMITYSASDYDYEYVNEAAKRIINQLGSYVYDTYGIMTQDLTAVQEFLENVPKQKIRTAKRHIFSTLRSICNIYHKLHKYCIRRQFIEHAKECEEKIYAINRLLEEVDERKYKKTAILKYKKAMSSFNEMDYEMAYYDFEYALELWKLSYEKTKNSETLWTLYQKSNEIGALFYGIELYEEAEYFFKLSYSYTQYGIFGGNEVLYKKIVEVSKKNLQLVERKNAR